jgi:hypothetical protein
VTFEKALRILPSFVAHLAADTDNDLARLRRKVEVEHFRMGKVIMENSETNSKSFRTEEIRDVDLKREQLARFLETTK